MSLAPVDLEPGWNDRVACIACFELPECLVLTNQFVQSTARNGVSSLELRFQGGKLRGPRVDRRSLGNSNRGEEKRNDDQEERDFLHLHSLRETFNFLGRIPQS